MVLVTDGVLLRTADDLVVKALVLLVLLLPVDRSIAIPVCVVVLYFLVLVVHDLVLANHILVKLTFFEDRRAMVLRLLRMTVVLGRKWL